MTEGEEFIGDFLEMESIIFQREVKLTNLKGDSKSYRKVDFYLPKYKVYIEFLGQWNSEINKERYREKKKIYKNNSIPCIYLYPENLGIIEYLFHKRLVLELKNYNLSNELWKYRFTELWKERSDNFIFLIIGFIVLFYNYPWFDNEGQFWSLIGGLIVGYQLFNIVKTIKQIFSSGPKNRRIFY